MIADEETILSGAYQVSCYRGGEITYLERSVPFREGEAWSEVAQLEARCLTLLCDHIGSRRYQRCVKAVMTALQDLAMAARDEHSLDLMPYTRLGCERHPPPQSVRIPEYIGQAFAQWLRAKKVQGKRGGHDRGIWQHARDF